MLQQKSVAAACAPSQQHGVRHRIGYQESSATDPAYVVGGHAVLSSIRPVALGPPLRGGRWAAIYHWQWPRGHRRVFYTLEGRARLPGRFAIDWVRIDDQGRQAHGDSDLVQNVLGYSNDVLAVTDARVADLRDGMQESERVSANPDHSLEEASGNYVSLDLGNGQFAVYEHLKPHSIRVKRGEHVRQGQVLALLGFTGDSTGPHLHFHVADNASPLLGEGLPFVFERFQVLGHYEDVAKLGNSRWLEPEPNRPRVRKRERPAPNVVLTFDGRRQ